MRRLRDARFVVGAGTFVSVFAAIALNHSAAQPLNKLPPARAPCSVLSGRPCHPSFCGAFHTGPCFPQYLAPFGENLQLTIESTDDNDAGNDPAGGAGKAGSEPDAAAEEKPLDSIGEMFAALRACWVPPPKDAARHGMQYTIRFAFKRDGELAAPPFVTFASHDAPPATREVYRDAVNATLTRCTPLHFSDGMAQAVAGQPIAVRFVDDRTVDSAKSP
jgi:hypothetical protein